MTVTPSATDLALVGDENPRDVPSEEPSAYAASYTVPGRPGFRLEVRRSGEVWMVVDAETGIHGVGETQSDALSDFFTAAGEHLDVLERQGTSLAADLVRQLHYLRERFA